MTSTDLCGGCEVNLIINNLLNKAQVGIILHPNQHPGSLSSPSNSSVTASERQREKLLKEMFIQARSKGADSQIKPICFVCRCQEGKQHSESTAGGTAGESTQGHCFLVQKKVPGPTCSSESFPGPWHSSPLPPVPPQPGSCWLSLTCLR